MDSILSQDLRPLGHIPDEKKLLCKLYSKLLKAGYIGEYYMVIKEDIGRCCRSKKVCAPPEDEATKLAGYSNKMQHARFRKPPLDRT